MSGLNWRDTFCSTVGTVALVYSTQPFDTTKTILQATKRDQKAMEVVYRVIRKGGIKKLWSGASASLAGYLIEHAFLFTLFEAAKRNVLGEERPRANMKQSLQKGLLCGSCSLFSSIPLCVAENVKVKLQAQSDVYKSPLQSISLIYSRNGVPGFFRGIQALWCRDAPFFATYICTYDYTFAHLTESGLPKVPSTLVGGAVGGALAWTVAFPIDVIKSRWQTKFQYKNMFHAVSSVLKYEGYSALTRGYWVAVTRGSLAYSCFACGYHLGRELVY